MRFALQRERERQSKKFQELSTEQKAPTIKRRRRRRRRPF
jgi:hypothetical protein